MIRGGGRKLSHLFWPLLKRWVHRGVAWAKVLSLGVRRLAEYVRNALQRVIQDYWALRPARWWVKYVEDQLDKVACCGWLLLLVSVFLGIPRILGWTRIDAVSKRPYTFLVDVNKADWPELTLLPRIGVVLSQRIVADRETRGLFTRPDDLLRVRGIGPKTLKKVQAYITLHSSRPQTVENATGDSKNPPGSSPRARGTPPRFGD